MVDLCLMSCMMLERNIWKVVLHVEWKILTTHLLASFYTSVASISSQLISCSYSVCLCSRRFLIWIPSKPWVYLSTIHHRLRRLWPHRGLAERANLIHHILLRRWWCILELWVLSFDGLTSVDVLEINLARRIHFCISTILLTKRTNRARYILKHM